MAGLFGKFRQSTNMAAKYLCAVCKRNVNSRYDDLLNCAECDCRVHLLCVGVSVEKFNEMNRDHVLESWKCASCVLTSKKDSDCSLVAGPSNPVTPSEGKNVTANGMSADVAEKDPNESIIIEQETVSKCCSCSSSIRSLFEENVKLRAAVQVQSDMIQALREEFRLQMTRVVDVLVGRDRHENVASVLNAGKDLTHKGNQPKRGTGRQIAQMKSNISDSADKPEMSPPTEIRSADYAPAVDEAVGYAAAVKIGNTNIVAQYDKGIASVPAAGNLEAEFTTATHKRRKQPSIVGTRQPNNSDSSFLGVQRRLWLYVGRTSKSTTEQSVLNYLKENTGEDDFTVARLAFKGDYPSFKVSAPLSLRERLNGPEFWPGGVIVRRFNFSSRNFLSTRKTEETARDPC